MCFADWPLPSQTSPASGLVNQMGKGYVQWEEIAGTDLQSHFEAAFARLVCLLAARM